MPRSHSPHIWGPIGCILAGGVVVRPGPASAMRSIFHWVSMLCTRNGPPRSKTTFGITASSTRLSITRFRFAIPGFSSGPHPLCLWRSHNFILCTCLFHSSASTFGGLSETDISRSFDCTAMSAFVSRGTGYLSGCLSDSNDVYTTAFSG
ncbi:hypothetical protein EDB89DRAFT_198038 [Lactarius sanguifluus]|nr:hypothetical protein EDB89DRAFT_198038 [Lactarius sanguifluus]